MTVRERAAAKLGLERRSTYWLWVGGPVPPGSSGITFRNVIAVRKRSANSERLIRHEMVHVAQYQLYGTVGFLQRYLTAYARNRLAGQNHRSAYLRIPFEIEAEFLARTTDTPID